MFDLLFTLTNNADSFTADADEEFVTVNGSTINYLTADETVRVTPINYGSEARISILTKDDRLVVSAVASALSFSDESIEAVAYVASTVLTAGDFALSTEELRTILRSYPGF